MKLLLLILILMKNQELYNEEKFSKNFSQYKNMLIIKELYKNKKSKIKKVFNNNHCKYYIIK